MQGLHRPDPAGAHPAPQAIPWYCKDLRELGVRVQSMDVLLLLLEPESIEELFLGQDLDGRAARL